MGREYSSYIAPNSGDSQAALCRERGPASDELGAGAGGEVSFPALPSIRSTGLEASARNDSEVGKGDGIVNWTKLRFKSHACQAAFTPRQERKRQRLLPLLVFELEHRQRVRARVPHL